MTKIESLLERIAAHNQRIIEQNVFRISVPEGVAQRLGRQPIDFISQYRMQLSWRAFHKQLK